ncbi:hypothetical protein [Paractinoplanes brasiliensis]|uniref:hypothetical protein n=1 Tax=Paractinoplanes brasiliensis TaxID=52695 RepID=UPI00105B4BC9|nr:hypothetical protein [Actinoplanes brasiliensis]GID31078.1 hypothetical protein Abr02nite_60610 [Actinoplanes brasiliensis]
MVARGAGQLVNVFRTIAFSGPAGPEQVPLRRAGHVANLALSVALSWALHAELAPHGIQVQACARASSRPSSISDRAWISEQSRG